jgi:hypothetical protein
MMRTGGDMEPEYDPAEGELADMAESEARERIEQLERALAIAQAQLRHGAALLTRCRGVIDLALEETAPLEDEWHSPSNIGSPAFALSGGEKPNTALLDDGGPTCFEVSPAALRWLLTGSANG